jgi:hypothetical protein
LIVNKGIPVVKFSSLPHTIQQSIRELTFDVRRIQEIKFFCVETQQYITKDHPDYDDDKVIDCPDRYMSDILGSDWAPEGSNFDNYTPPDVFYRAVRKAAERKYGKLPF